jgi:hypothetical protein
MVKTPKPSTIRWSDADYKLIKALKAKLGILSAAELIRLALRTLAQKEGVAS